VIDLMQALRASLEKKPASPSKAKASAAAPDKERKPAKRAMAAVPATAAPKKVRKNA
jgi:hypothetical protein